MKNITETINEGILDRKLVGTETSLCAQALLLYYDFASKHKDKIGDGLYNLKFVEETWRKLGYNVAQVKDLAKEAADFAKQYD